MNKAILSPAREDVQCFFLRVKALPDIARAVCLFKEVTREIVCRLFLAQADLFRRTKDHNSADAALLAVYSEERGEKLGN